jgi:hypothetical protein
VTRIVAIGDLNGAADALDAILYGTGLVDVRGRWVGARARLVQLGDVLNRGTDARRALLRLRSLARQAREAGGRVDVLLGNHEVMTALGNESYCTIEEYLSFAPVRAQRAWPGRAMAQMRKLFRDHPPGGPILPLRPRLDAWALDVVPGRRELRRALGPRGSLGRMIRSLPVAVKIDRTAFVHSVPSPRWVKGGVEGLNEAAREAWKTAPAFWRQLPRGSIFRAVDGPLWNRELVDRETRAHTAQVDRTLRLFDVDRIVVGHTPTVAVPRGVRGHIALLHGGRVVCADVSIEAEEHAPLAALDIRGDSAWEWTPFGSRQLW